MREISGRLFASRWNKRSVSMLHAAAMSICSGVRMQRKQHENMDPPCTSCFDCREATAKIILHSLPIEAVHCQNLCCCCCWGIANMGRPYMGCALSHGQHPSKWAFKGQLRNTTAQYFWLIWSVHYEYTLRTLAYENALRFTAKYFFFLDGILLTKHCHLLVTAINCSQSVSNFMYYLNFYLRVYYFIIQRHKC